MASLAQLEREIKRINGRNARVEADKAWETSWERKALVFAATYCTVSLFLIAAGIPDPFLNAAVPSAAFVLSTLTLGAAKRLWLEKIYGK